MRAPEILAPAGSREALEAALHAGADAVYFGVEGHNARARARNFAVAELGDIMARIHARGARGYLTLNTLVFDDELEDVASILAEASRSGVDAIIVQDLGLARLARRLAPALHLHASTQMTCTDASSVEFAAGLGARRVVLARELSIADIASIQRELAGRVEVELEVFVHGALCISYSGQCLTSEAIGGRSANRGACAQACRLEYELIVDGVARSLPGRPYLLSPQDLDASELVPALMQAGVASFKIEGRLKSPEYVAATVRLYRQAIDDALTSSGDTARRHHRQLQAHQAYSRGSGPGFLGGVDHQILVEAQSCSHRGVELGTVLEVRAPRGELLLQPLQPLQCGDGLLVLGGPGRDDLGGHVWSMQAVNRGVWVWLGPDRQASADLVGCRVFRSGSPHLLRPLTHEPPARRPVRMRVAGRIDAPLMLEAWDDRGHHAATASRMPLVEARARALDTVELGAKLGRLGDSPFELATLESDLEGNLMIPPSELNQMRRDVVAKLLEARAPIARPAAVSLEEALRETQAPLPTEPPNAGLFVLVRNGVQAKAALEAGADGIYLDFLDLTGTGNALRELQPLYADRIGVCPPRIRKPGEEKIERFLARLQPAYVLVRTLGLLNARWDGPKFIGDFSLNAANRLTARELLERGLCAITAAHDLDALQLRRFASSSDLAPFLELVVHHPMPFFHMEHCVFAAMLSQGSDFRTCGRPCEHHRLELRDRTGALHPLEADVGCRNTVFRGAPQSAANEVSALQELGVRRFRIECLRETATQVAHLVTAYRGLLAGTSSARKLREGLSQHGLRTVRGSLQVV